MDDNNNLCVEAVHKFRIATFQTSERKRWRDPSTRVEEIDGQWGGETAAELFGGDLRASRAVLYAHSVPTKWAARLRWESTPPAEADIEVRRRFWTNLGGRHSTCPSILVYADLLAAADPRLREAAEQLRRSDARLAEIDQS